MREKSADSDYSAWSDFNVDLTGAQSGGGVTVAGRRLHGEIRVDGGDAPGIDRRQIAHEPERPA